MLSSIAQIRHTTVRLVMGSVLMAAAIQGWAATYPLGEGDATQMVGQDTRLETHYSDTLYDLARKYGVSSEELIRANPHVDPWLPGEGTPIVIPDRHILPPGPRDGIVINLAEHRLYYYPPSGQHQPRVVITYPVSIGQMDWRTPLGKTHIVQKIPHPSWYPPPSIRKVHAEEGDPLPAVVPPGPDNPLGDFAMRLAVPPGDYMIHGTNNPIAVGMPITHGCVRLYPEDIAALFPQVPNGTAVYLVNEPIKLANVAGQPWVEVHPPVDARGQTIQPDVGESELLFLKVLRDNSDAIDWDAARDALGAANGMPVAIGQPPVMSPPVSTASAAGGG